MDGVKGILSSKTFWANVIGLIALLPGVTKYTTGMDLDGLSTAISTVIPAIAFLASTVFRVTATKQLVVGGAPARTGFL